MALLALSVSLVSPVLSPSRSRSSRLQPRVAVFFESSVTPRRCPLRGFIFQGPSLRAEKSLFNRLSTGQIVFRAASSQRFLHAAAPSLVAISATRYPTSSLSLSIPFLRVLLERTVGRYFRLIQSSRYGALTPFKDGYFSSHFASTRRN